MKTDVRFTRKLIAPCGINCGTCMAYLREKNRCFGCLIPFNDKCKSRVLCSIKNCEKRNKLKSKFCFDCDTFPCKLIKHIDQRYSTRYHQSLKENLIAIQETGMKQFLESEKIKWTCPNCGSALSVHREYCLECKRPRK